MTSLVLSRRFGQRIRIGTDADHVWITILGFHGTRKNQLNIRIEAPADVPVLREEVVERSRTECAVPHTAHKE